MTKKFSLINSMASLLLLQLGFLLSTSSLAMEAGKQESIERLITETGADIMITNMAQQHIITVIEKNIGEILLKENMQNSLTANQRQEIIKVAHNNSQILFKDISSKETQGQVFGLYVAIMDKTYSKEDIDAQLAFFSSPAGKNLQTKQPQAMQALNINSFPIILKQATPILDNKLKAQLAQDINKALLVK